MNVHHSQPTARHDGPPVLIANTHTPVVSRDYAVKGMLWLGEVSVLNGASNIGKTAIANRLGWHVCTGEEFAGRRARRGAVVHVAAERPESVLTRAAVLFDDDDPRSSDAAPYFVYGARVDLRCPRQVAALISWIVAQADEADVEVRLIIIDTAVLCIGDGDENSAKDVTEVIEGAKLVASETNSHVMLIHHTGKSAAGSRGSSVWFCNIDADFPLLVVERDGQEWIALTDKKARDSAKGLNARFVIEGYPLGLDDDGDLATAPIARLLEAGEPGLPSSGPAPKSGKRNGASGAGSPAGDNPAASTPSGPDDARVSAVAAALERLSASDPAKGVSVKQILAACDLSIFGASDAVASQERAVRRALKTLSEGADVRVRRIDDRRYAWIALPAPAQGREDCRSGSSGERAASLAGAVSADADERGGRIDEAGARGSAPDSASRSFSPAPAPRNPCLQHR